MKFICLLLILCCAITFSACHKDAQPSEHFNGKVLPGVWELRAAVGGNIIPNPDHYKPGNGTMWKFTPTEFKAIFENSVYKSGSYSISVGTGTDPNTGRKIDEFIFNNDPGQSFELKNDTLKFYDGAIISDGAITMYVKISDNY